jgi:hypothetical protein
MALAFDHVLTPRDASRSIATEPLSDEAAHERTYRKFVFFARCAMCAVPFFVAFILYWTT